MIVEGQLVVSKRKKADLMVDLAAKVGVFLLHETRKALSLT